MKRGLNGYKPSKNILIRSGIVLLGTVVLAIIMKFQEGSFQEEITRIGRNEYGDGVKTEELNMQIEGEEEQVVLLEISPRVYSDDEIENLFSAAEKELEKVMLGENNNLQHITANLSLPYKLETYPFQISWQFSRYDIVDMNGNFKQDKIKALDPQCRGIPLSVNASLRYEQKEYVTCINMTVYSSKETDLSISEKVLESVSQSNKQSQENSYLELPSMINGKKIVWVKNEESNIIAILLTGLIISCLLIFLDWEKAKEAEKKKKEQMLFDYPEIVSQIIILMGAGMTTKNAWKKMVDDYREQKNSSGRSRWAYEEMEFTFNEMQNGIPELECYERFAKRCDLMPYIKLGALLAQNLKKGTKGLWLQLEMEAHQSMNDRKNQIKKLGEEAGTKLLLPMLIMLIVVLLIVIVPAFLSIQI